MFVNIKNLVLYAAKAIVVAVVSMTVPILLELFADVSAQVTVGATGGLATLAAFVTRNAPSY